MDPAEIRLIRRFRATSYSCWQFAQFPTSRSVHRDVPNKSRAFIAPLPTENNNILIVKISLRHWLQVTNLFIAPSPTAVLKSRVLLKRWKICRVSWMKYVKMPTCVNSTENLRKILLKNPGNTNRAKICQTGSWKAQSSSFALRERSLHTVPTNSSSSLKKEDVEAV